MSCITDGYVANSLWEISNKRSSVKVNVQVEDEFVSSKDGVDITITSNGRNKTFTEDTIKVEIYLDGTINVYEFFNGRFVEVTSSDIDPEIRLIKQHNEIKGYNRHVQGAGTR